MGEPVEDPYNEPWLLSRSLPGGARGWHRFSTGHVHSPPAILTRLFDHFAASPPVPGPPPPLPRSLLPCPTAFPLPFHRPTHPTPYIMGCLAMCCTKSFLFVINAIFLILGLALMAAGTYGMVYYAKYDFISTGGLAALIGLGAVVCFVSGCGVCGVVGKKEKRKVSGRRGGDEAEMWRRSRSEAGCMAVVL